MDIAGLDLDNIPRDIWNTKEIPKMHLPAIGTKFGSTFQVVDKYLKVRDEGYEKEPSYVDFAFGHPTYSFAGCHRFTIERGLRLLDGEGEGKGEEEQVEISLMHFRCNPSEDRDSIAEWISWFHKWYATALFMDGVRFVLRA